MATVDAWWAFGCGDPPRFRDASRSILDAMEARPSIVAWRWLVEPDGEPGEPVGLNVSECLVAFARWCAGRAVASAGAARDDLVNCLETSVARRAADIAASARRGTAERHAAASVVATLHEHAASLAFMASRRAIEAAAEAEIAGLDRDPRFRFMSWLDVRFQERRTHEAKLFDLIDGRFRMKGGDGAAYYGLTGWEVQ